MSFFAKNLKKYRTEKGISQEELAKKVGVHTTHLSRYERGLSQPSIEVAQKLAEAFDISVDELIQGSADENIRKTIKDRELLNLFHKVQVLEEEKQKTVKDLISAFIFKEDVQRKLAS